MHAGGGWRLGRRPALDGLRGVAILLVLCAHFDNPLTNPLSGAGVAGVTVFFTLSGFLITSLLLDELRREGRVSLARFYRRRAFRLLPALFAVLLAVMMLQASGRTLRVPGGMFAAVVLYASNWWQMAHPGNNGLGHTWSLSIEEQFYLVWPAALLLGARWGRRGITWVALVGMAVSLVAISAPGGSMSRGSLERASSLLAGCLLAVWMSGRREGRARPLVAAAALAGIAVAALVGATAPIVLGVPVATAVALWAVAQGDGPSWLSGSVLGWFGRRSYGIYLWHYPLIFAFMSPVSWVARSCVILPLSLLVAELSWRLIEEPFQRLGHRSGKRLDRSPVPVARQGGVERLDRSPVPLT